MTRKRLNKLRRKYNAYRRVNRGWTPKQWDRMLIDDWKSDIHRCDFNAYMRDLDHHEYLVARVNGRIVRAESVSVCLHQHVMVYGTEYVQSCLLCGKVL